MTGSLLSSKGKFYAVINLKDESGNRKQKAVNLYLDNVPGNKRKAEKALREVLAKYEQDHIIAFPIGTMWVISTLEYDIFTHFSRICRNGKIEKSLTIIVISRLSSGPSAENRTRGLLNPIH